MSSLFKEEEEIFSNYLNYFLDGMISRNNEFDLSSQIAQGIIIAHFINIIEPNIIDVRAINQPNITNNTLTAREMIQNQNLNIWAVKTIGLKSTLTVKHLIDTDNKGLTFAFLWMLIRKHLLLSINASTYPLEIKKLFNKDTSEHWTIESLLTRWVNSHVTKQKYNKFMNNFGKDLKDGCILTVLFLSITGNNDCSDIDGVNNLREKLKHDLNKMGRKIFFLSTKFERHEKFNIALVAELFHWNSCAKIAKINTLVCGYCRSQNIPYEIVDLIIKWSKLQLNVSIDSHKKINHREEMMFMKWINSLFDHIVVRNLYLDCSDGLLLLKIIDAIQPDCVQWGKKVSGRPYNRWKKLHNANYVVLLAKHLKLKLISVRGADIVDMNEYMITGLIWQFMRYYLMKSLGLKYNRYASEDLLNICNECIMNSEVNVKPQIKSFNDDLFSSGIYCICLVSAVCGVKVNWKFVKQNAVENSDKISNANYGISLFVMEGFDMLVTAIDIVNGNSKMRVVFCAYVMNVSSFRK